MIGVGRLRRAGRAIAVIAAGLAGLTGALARAENPSGAPAITASIDTTVAPVGAPLDMTVEVAPAEGWLVDPPTKELTLEPFRVRSVERLERVEGSAWRLRLVPLSPGDAEIPAVELTAHGPRGAQETIATAPIPVSIVSNLSPPGTPAEGEAAPGDTPDGVPGGGPANPGAPPGAPERAEYKPALEAPRDWRPLVLALAGFVVAAAIGAWVLRKLRARRRAVPEETTPSAPRKPLRPAWETAIEELDRIAAAAYLEQGEIDRQYVEVTEVVRRYLENRYGVPALESTTDELRARLRGSAVPPPAQTRVLALLREADLVKFAKGRPENAEMQTVESTARAIIVDTIPRSARGEAA